MRWLRICWIAIGSALVVVFLFIAGATLLLEWRRSHAGEPADQPLAQNAAPEGNPAPPAEPASPAAELLPVKNTPVSHEEVVHADELHRLLGPTLVPLERTSDPIAVTIPAPPPLEASRPAPKPQPDKPSQPPVPPPVPQPPPPAPQPPPPAPPAEKSAADVAFEQRLDRSEEDLRKELLEMPELRLLSDIDVQAFRQMEKTSDRTVRTAQKGNIDYLCNLKLAKSLRQEGLKAGLPLQSGPQCQLDRTAASIVQTVSKELRDKGFVSVPGLPAQVRFGTGRVVRVAGTTLQNGSAPEKLEAFKEWCDLNKVEKFRGALATLLQMLQVEDAPTRLLLVRELDKFQSPATTIVLAKRAIVDLSPEVRQAAVLALRKRPANQYLPVLLQGLRYPWPPVADHAASTLRLLKPDGAVPKLVELLDQPSPSVPVLDKKSNKTVVRELVRLNHMRNCLLCHAPSSGPNDGLVRGAVPTPGKPLPPAYYQAQTGDFARADTIFLTQDFSVILPVKNATPWPNDQRFDFVTRLRPPTPEEMRTIARLPKPGDKPDMARPAKPGDGAEIARPDKPKDGPDVARPGKPAEMRDLAGPSLDYPQRDAVLYALRGLTGKDGGTSTRKWKELLFVTSDDKTGQAKK